MRAVMLAPDTPAHIRTLVEEALNCWSGVLAQRARQASRELDEMVRAPDGVPDEARTVLRERCHRDYSNSKTLAQIAAHLDGEEAPDAGR